MGRTSHHCKCRSLRSWVSLQCFCTGLTHKMHPGPWRSMISQIVSSRKEPMLEKYVPQVYSVTFQRRPLGLSPVITISTQAQGGLTPWGLYSAVTCPHLSGCLAEVEPSFHKCHTAAVQIGPCHEQSFAVKVPGSRVPQPWVDFSCCTVGKAIVTMASLDARSPHCCLTLEVTLWRADPQP